jgi:hypothetical protein
MNGWTVCDTISEHPPSIQSPTRPVLACSDGVGESSDRLTIIICPRTSASVWWKPWTWGTWCFSLPPLPPVSHEVYEVTNDL